MTHLEHALTFSLPDWLGAYAGTYRPVADFAERMRFVVGAAARNVAEGTGGPFAAAVFEEASGRLLALGVNLVTTEQLSVLHAEIVALSLAQRHIGGFDLGAPGLPAHQLVTSTEPCAMCFGAIPWSGVRHLVTGAQDADARAIGFDEGPKPADWVGALQRRSISVTTDVLRDEACEVLLAYRKGGGKIYNARGGETI
jgi:tRNA(Arg) A34 adenosine deaminase TadA